jgi:dTMP kinase
MLEEQLKALGMPAIFTVEPGGTEAGRMIRRILMDSRVNLFPLPSLFLYTASRCQAMMELFMPARREGKWIIADRSLYSSLAYQAGAEGITPEFIRKISRVAMRDFWPAKVVLCDVDTKIAMDRIYNSGNKATRYDIKAEAYHRSVRAAYLAEANRDRDRFLILDMSPSPQEIFKTLWEQLAPLLGVPPPYTIYVSRPVA